MNAEIYFPREGKSFGCTSEKGFEETVKGLNNIDVNIIYKTEINLTEKSLLEALKVTDSGNDKINMVLIADTLSDDSPEKAKEFFESIGISGKVKRINAVLKEIPEETDDNSKDKEYPDKKSRKQAEKQEKELEKLRKKQQKQLKKQQKKQKNNNSETKHSDVKPSEKTEKKLFAYYAEHNKKLIVILPKPEFLDTDFNTLLFSVVNAVVNPDKKPAFWKRFIPCSGDRPLDVVRKIVLMLAICTFVVSSYMLVNILIVEPTVSDSTNSGIKDLLVSTSDESESSQTKKPNDGSEGSLVDFKKLLEVNPDTIGWITVPDTKIDYVVVKPSEDKDKEYYLYRDFYGNDTKYGSIFMDYRSTLDSKNLILHGHHMQDGRMFANLINFSDLDVYKKTPTFTFNTIYEKSKWKIISIFKTNTLESQGDFFNYLRGDFKNNYDFLNFIYQLRERSIIDCPVDVNENDTLVTLSTCAYDFDDFRFVVVARKVRDGESAKVDVSKADYNPNPLYPEIWYKRYGGTAPTVTTFQDAYNKGEINWYDGKKKDWSKYDDDLLARELSEAKTKSVKKLEDYVEKKHYADDEQKKIDELIKKYTKKINGAENISELKEIYNQALKDIKKVKTTEQQASAKEESETAVKNARSSAIVEMKNSIAGNTYRLDDADNVNKIIDDYTDKINNQTDLDKIEELKNQCIKELAKIKTHDELKKEESEKAEEESKQKAEQLAEVKKSAVAELKDYVSLSDYYESEQSDIKSLISYYTTLINDSPNENSVSQYLAGAKSEIDNVKTAEQIDKEQSSEQSSEEPSDDTSETESSVEETTAENQ
ncbi:MAG: class B sortase [Acutalibacteraceae bacterium]